MNYTIAIMEEIHSGQTLEVIMDGCKYFVYLYDKASGGMAKAVFGSVDAAYNCFCTAAKWLICGDYSFAQRCKMLSQM